MFDLHLISFFILISGIVDDLRSRKIHNKLILFLIPIALSLVALIEGPQALLYVSLPSGLVALGLSLPLYFLKIIGGGDLKLYFTVSLTWATSETFWSLIWAFPIGLVFGLLRVCFQGKMKDFFQNVLSLILLKKPKNLQTFPFSIALFFGWMTFKVLEKI